MLQQISCAATALDYSYARQSLAATTSTSWYQAVATRQLVAVDEQALQTYEGLLRLAKVKLAAGAVTVKPGVWVYQITPLRLEPTSSR